MKLVDLKVNKLSSELSDIQSQWLNYTPTLTWTTAIPVGVVTKFRYKIIGKTVFFTFKITATDGNGTTSLKISLPKAPATNNIIPALVTQTAFNGSYASKYISLRDDGVNNDLNFIYLATAPVGQNLNISIQGFYEIS